MADLNKGVSTYPYNKKCAKLLLKGCSCQNCLMNINSVDCKTANEIICEFWVERVYLTKK